MSANRPPATSDRLRAAIDAGLTQDKVRGFDPAAAPLGTDDEAGGASPTSAQVAAAFDYEVKRTRAAATPRQRGLGAALAAILFGLFAVALLAWLVG